jgi:dimeric dUTPase (all-alpha-NTP-PPase superfamily)
MEVNMNLTKLFEMQRELDERIVKEKGLEGKDLLPQKILALQVELGECANEWRGFKFWSARQTPKEPEYNWKPNEDGSNLVWEPEYGYKSHPLLEEYIDCLHFILSIGLHDEDYEIYYSENFQFDTVIDAFNYVFAHVSLLPKRIDEWRNVMDGFLELGRMIGFTWEQIKAAYMAKNAVNHNRQSTGY